MNGDFMAIKLESCDNKHCCVQCCECIKMICQRSFYFALELAREPCEHKQYTNSNCHLIARIALGHDTTFSSAKSKTKIGQFRLLFMKHGFCINFSFELQNKSAINSSFIRNPLVTDDFFILSNVCWS